MLIFALEINIMQRNRNKIKIEALLGNINLPPLHCVNVSVLDRVSLSQFLPQQKVTEFVPINSPRKSAYLTARLLVCPSYSKEITMGRWTAMIPRKELCL